jgi:dihydroorotate dehydrogenase electron transfer subunit
MKRYQPTLVENQRLGPDLYSLWTRFDSPFDVEPGQFFEFATGVRFLRRAFSVADKDADRLRFILRVVGAGTQWLSELSLGSRLDVSGPLGRGVVLPSEGPVMLLAGGVGAAPLLHFARKLNERGIKVDALLAAARGEELILVEEFRPLCRNLTLATDDGSCGKKGRLTDVLPALPRIHDVKVFYTCGPEPMFAAIKRMGIGKPVYAFLESRMGCGTGLCVGCAVLGRDGRYHRVCTEGAVFNLEEIEL